MANLDVPNMQDLLSAGVHFGHKVSRGHPRMKDYIFGAREGVHIINLEHSEAKLKEAVQAAYEMGKAGKVMVVVGTKKQAKPIIEEALAGTDIPYVTERWIGGLLTNFDELKKNFRKLLDLKSQREAGKLDRTKKELLLISRKLDKFDKELGGVATLDKIPDVLFIIDAVADNTAVLEANRVGIEVIGLCDSNANPDWYNYPVPANDDGIKAIKIVVDPILKAYIQGKKEAQKGTGDGVLGSEKSDKSEFSDSPKKAEKKASTEEAAVEDATVAAEVENEVAVLEEQVEKEIVEKEQKRTE